MCFVDVLNVGLMVSDVLCVKFGKFVVVDFLV